MILSWDTVRGLSNSKIIATTSIWVFIVPALTKLINNQIINLELLPLTFVILYFSGVAFFLGAVAFKLFSPTIISKFDSYSSFSEEGGNLYLLQGYLTKLSPNNSDKIMKIFKEYVGEASPSVIDEQSVETLEVGKEKKVFTFENGKLKDIFWIIYSHFATSRPLLIGISLLFHILGFLGLTYLFIYNFWVVISR